MSHGVGDLNLSKHTTDPPAGAALPRQGEDNRKVRLRVIKKIKFYGFFILRTRSTPQRAAEPARYHTHGRGTRRTAKPDGADRAPAHRSEDLYVCSLFWGGLGGSRFTGRHTREPQLGWVRKTFLKKFL